MQNGYIFAASNFKGGCGKTATVLNLGAALSSAGKSVLLIDGDAQSNLTAALGYTPAGQSRTLSNLLQAHFLASEGIPDVLELVKSVREKFNPKLKIVGILLTMYQSRPQLCQSVRASVGEVYGESFHVFQRPIPGTDCYEILAGHNRTAARLAGWTIIPAEIVEADDVRAIVIATSTNLIQRQNLSIIDRGKAYKALLDAKNRQGHRSDIEPLTSGDSHQKYSAPYLDGRSDLTPIEFGELLLRPYPASGKHGER